MVVGVVARGGGGGKTVTLLYLNIFYSVASTPTGTCMLVEEGEVSWSMTGRVADCDCRFVASSSTKWPRYIDKPAGSSWLVGVWAWPTDCTHTGYL